MYVCTNIISVIDRLRSYNTVKQKAVLDAMKEFSTNYEII
jgi:hypothetical protein